MTIRFRGRLLLRARTRVRMPFHPVRASTGSGCPPMPDPALPQGRVRHSSEFLPEMLLCLRVRLRMHRAQRSLAEAEPAHLLPGRIRAPHDSKDSPDPLPGHPNGPGGVVRVGALGEPAADLGPLLLVELPESSAPSAVRAAVPSALVRMSRSRSVCRSTPGAQSLRGFSCPPLPGGCSARSVALNCRFPHWPTFAVIFRSPGRVVCNP